ncbi:sugar glycosyltransferase [Enterobacteriaceae bacterium H18W14]|uniref:sugar glycosyltransferase n=1 Tax=Dryocola boscaweniae TaxID=2925397 RepID=UPI0022F0A8A8|nr:sugar glycosyltransferase [Dryocola boscaweniae]MCT4714164.1 sugar glycosyltransferase [Dryocola boscaweniae]
MGTLTKQIYRYTHPRSMRHNENLWPFVKIQRNANDAISLLTYKNENVPLVDLSALKGFYAGEVLLTATGPSIKNIDFSRIPSLPTVGVNGAWHLNKYLHFDIYIIVDMLFIDNKPEILKEIICNRDLILFTTTHGIIRLIDKFSLENIQCQIAIIEDKCYQIYKPTIKKSDINKNFALEKSVIFSDANNDIAFNYDIRSGIFDAGTVVYWSLQVLAFLGFNKIYIAGLDMNNFSSPRFYETQKEMLPSFLADKLDSLIIPAFKLARYALNEHHVEVINLSIESAVPSHIFSKMDYSDAFK